MKKDLKFEESKAIIEGLAFKHIKFEINKYNADLTGYVKGKEKVVKNVVCYDVVVNNKCVVSLPYDRIPFEFIACGAWQKQQKLDDFFSQYAIFYSAEYTDMTEFEIDVASVFIKRHSFGYDTLTVNFGLRDLFDNFIDYNIGSDNGVYF